MTTSAERPYVFHAFEVSYFSAKVRPALRYKRLWVDEVHADYRLIRERTGLTFIPVLITPEDETWQDSTDIYDRLEAHTRDLLDALSAHFAVHPYHPGRAHVLRRLRADGAPRRPPLHRPRVARAAARDGASRRRMDRALQPPERAGPGRMAGSGWEAVLAHEPRHRVAKRGFDLVLAPE